MTHKLLFAAVALACHCHCLSKWRGRDTLNIFLHCSPFDHNTARLKHLIRSRAWTQGEVRCRVWGSRFRCDNFIIHRLVQRGGKHNKAGALGQSKAMACMINASITTEWRRKRCFFFFFCASQSWRAALLHAFAVSLKQTCEHVGGRSWRIEPPTLQLVAVAFRPEPQPRYYE